MANSIDPDQMPHFAASDLGLYWLLRPVSPTAQCYLGIIIVFPHCSSVIDSIMFSLSSGDEL